VLTEYCNLATERTKQFQKQPDYKAKEKNEQFLEEYSKVVNRFSLEFMQMFCDASGAIHWDKVVQFNSAKP
jgi:hypothetical protein